MRFAQVNDICVHYALDGADGAPVILFANSIGTDLRIWDVVVDQLAADYRLLRYDMRGHGLTDATPGPYSIAQLADDALGLLDALDIDQVYLCGLSIGGMLAQQLAADHPERVRAAAFCDTSMRMPNRQMWDERAGLTRAEGLDGMAEAAMTRWFTEAYRAEQPVAPYRNMFARTAREGYAGCCEALRDMDLEQVTPRIRVPSLVLVGEQDQATPPAAAEALAGAIPDARLEVIPQAAHVPCVEQPATVAASLRAFFRQQA